MAYSANYEPISPAGSADSATTCSNGEDEGYPLRLPDDTHASITAKHRPWAVSGLAIRILGTLLVIVLYTWAVLYYAREVIYKPFCPRLTAPDTMHVWDEVEFRPQLVNPVTPDKSHPFLGDPSPDVDANWTALLSAFSNRIPDSEVQRLGIENDAIPFDDGEGSYYGGIAMIHNLHCINYLYQVAHRDYYYTSPTTKKEDATQQSHIAHCLHHIMESVKCQADLTPVVLHWTVHDYYPVINWNGVERTCADWSQLMDWGSKHAVKFSTASKLAELRHPIYGNFLDENGKFDYVDQEGEVDFGEFSKRPEYQKWAQEQGVAMGEAAAEAYIESSYSKGTQSL